LKRRISIAVLGIFWILCGVLSGTAQETAKLEIRESILDRIVHIEKDLKTEIPSVPRLCDSLTVKKDKINIGDCELYVEEEGQGMPLVLINGGPGGTHHYFHPWFSRVKDYARVIYYDQRGCGLSDYQPGKDGYSVDQAVGDLEGIRKALGIDRWVVLGYSYGGFLAQYYATKHPESMAGLILLGASPGMWVQMKPTRQYDFLSKEERARIREIPNQAKALGQEQKWEPKKILFLQVYNAHLNGDWKRQHFYRPSPEKLAQGALYEWTYDLINNFRSGINNSMDKIDLTGAFGKCPIPTLILEGKWDLTWNTDKPEIIANNHPGAKLVLFENAGHGIYDEETEAFFSVLKDFMLKRRAAEALDVAPYRAYLADWDQQRKSSPLYIVRSTGNSIASLAKIAKAYTKTWCDELQDWPLWLLKVGLAHYDVNNYAEAQYVFEKIAQFAEKKQNMGIKALALIWQGHMLDLQGKRSEAINRYKQVVDLDIKDTWEHNMYGLKYEVSSYAKERMMKPFVRIENTLKD